MGAELVHSSEIWGEGAVAPLAPLFRSPWNDIVLRLQTPESGHGFDDQLEFLKFNLTFQPVKFVIGEGCIIGRKIAAKNSFLIFFVVYTILFFLHSTLYFAISTFNILCATLNFSYSLKSSFDLQLFVFFIQVYVFNNLPKYSKAFVLFSTIKFFNFRKYFIL